MPLPYLRPNNWKEVMWRSAKPHTYPTPHVLCCFSCVWLFVILWTVACQAPPSMGFSRQQYWSGLPCPPPGDLPDPGIELVSPALQVDFLPLSHCRNPSYDYGGWQIPNLQGGPAGWRPTKSSWYSSSPKAICWENSLLLRRSQSFVLLRPSLIGWVPLTRGRLIRFIQSPPI